MCEQNERDMDRLQDMLAVTQRMETLMMTCMRRGEVNSNMKYRMKEFANEIIEQLDHIRN